MKLVVVSLCLISVAGLNNNLLCPKMHVALNVSKSTCVLIVLSEKSFFQAESFCVGFSDYLVTLATGEFWDELVIMLNELATCLDTIQGSYLNINW